MKNLWIWLLIGLIVIFFWVHKRGQDSSRPQTESESAQLEQKNETTPSGSTAQTALKSPEPINQGDTKNPQGTTQVTPLQSRTTLAPKIKQGSNPQDVDVFSLRKLDLPKPKSVAELLEKITDYKRPMLPKPYDDMGDGDVWTGFRGYYELASGNLKRVQVNQTSGGVSVSIEDTNGAYHEWDEQKNELKIKNFDHDPYSLVIFVPDHRVLYLKFYTKMIVPDLNRPPRAMVGWILSNGSSSAKVWPTALIDFQFEGYDNPLISGKDRWPPAEYIKKIMPVNL